jgi:hypothetical protein
MTSTTDPRPADPSLLRTAAGTVAVSIATALLTGLVLLTQTAPVGAPAATPRAEAAASTHSERAGAANPARLDEGVNWDRVEREPNGAGESVSAYAD